jgi:hypothetical protein
MRRTSAVRYASQISRRITASGSFGPGALDELKDQSPTQHLGMVMQVVAEAMGSSLN